MTLEKKKSFLINTAFIVVALLLFYVVFRFLLIYLLPFVIGFFIAMAVRRPAAFLAKKTRIKRELWSVALVLIVYFALIGIVGWFGYWLYQQISGFLSSIPGYIPQLTALLDNINAKLFAFFDSMPSGVYEALKNVPEQLLKAVTDVLPGMLSSFAGSIVKRTPALLISAIVTIVASCYIAKDYALIVQFVRNQLSKKQFNAILDVKKMLSQNIFRILRSYLLLMFITFIELSLGLLLMRIPYAVAVAAIIAVVDILPILGTGTVVIPWAIIELISGNIWRAIGLIILYLVITIVRNFLEPKIVGAQMGLHPVLTLISMFCGLQLFGFLGMFGLPLVVIILINLQKQGKLHFFRTSEEAERETPEPPVQTQ